MRYQLLGRSGLRVSELCLGTMTFGETWGWGASKEESARQVALFRDQGGNFIDTSVNYTDGASEEIIGEVIEADRDYWVLATKYTLTSVDNTDPNNAGNSRKNMRRSVERSLRRLKTDYLDVLYLHAWDYMTPVEEVMRGLDDLVSQGKVNYIALSDSPAYIAAEANTRAELMGWSRFVGLQIPYSLSMRDPERELLRMAKHWDMAVLPWGVLGAGVLLGKYSKDSTETTRYDRDGMRITERQERIIEAVAQIAEETGRSRAQVCINWVRQQPHAQIIPILGARRADQLADNLAAVEWTLSDDQLQRLTEASSIEVGFPRSFLEGGARQFIFGKTFDQIDNHRKP